MPIPLIDAVATTAGAKAAALGALLRAGLPVPGGFVLGFDAYRAAAHRGGVGATDRPGAPVDVGAIPTTLYDALAGGLSELGDVPVAVRSSADDEDTGRTSAAGQHETLLAVRGVDAVADAVRTCWASLHSARATTYRATSGAGQSGGAAMAVVVQRLVDAEVSGVLFTPTGPDGVTRIESAWGLGPSVVGGTVTPDAFQVTTGGAISSTIADKPTRLDRDGARLVSHAVPRASRRRPSLDRPTIARLARLGRQVADAQGGPQDVEWAIADGRIWLLQARPITAAPPPTSDRPAIAAERSADTADVSTGTTGEPASTAEVSTGTTGGSAGAAGEPTGTASRMPGTTDGMARSTTPMAGTPGSRGQATGTARIVRGPADFARVRPGDILVCRYTDPAWTPLLRSVAGVVTEVGGVLCHAAIVARERRIPAVLGVPDALAGIREGTTVTVDGGSGTVWIPVPPDDPGPT